MDRDQLEEEVRRRDWFHRFEIADGLWTDGYYEAKPSALFNTVELPQDMAGLTALDLGCADGLFGLEMARRGADVTAIDVFPPDYRNVEFLSRLWNLPIRYRQATIWDFGGGPFDLILFMGVLYHLQYPLLGLHRLNALCRPGAIAVLESAVARGRGLAMTFLPGRELADDPSNWWLPTTACLEAMIQSAGFEIVRRAPSGRGRKMMKIKKVKECGPAVDADSVMMANFGHPAH